MEDLPAQPYSSPRLLKWLYCTHRVGSTLALLPYWAIKYACSKRPRPSWSLAETLLIDFTRRVSAISDRAGVQHATRDPTAQPDRDSLRETRFEWVPGIAGELCCGVLDDAQVRPLKRVGTFVWERAQDVRADYNMINSKTSNEGDAASTLSFRPDAGDKGDLVGVYFHGGGYTHFSAHESAQTSAIPRRLMQVSFCAAKGASTSQLTLPAPTVRLLRLDPLYVTSGPDWRLGSRWLTLRALSRRVPPASCVEFPSRAAGWHLRLRASDPLGSPRRKDCVDRRFSRRQRCPSDGSLDPRRAEVARRRRLAPALALVRSVPIFPGIDEFLRGTTES